VVVPVGEPCSTMTCPVCGTLHSPGTHYLHSCPNCQSTSIRGESGRAIEHMTCVNASFALGKLNKSGHLNGQAALNLTAFQAVWNFGFKSRAKRRGFEPKQRHQIILLPRTLVISFISSVTAAHAAKKKCPAIEVTSLNVTSSHYNLIKYP
jgi:hypothetical protein